MDGQAVYSLLLGKPSYIFRGAGTGPVAAGAGGQVFGDFAKEYADGEGWTEDFGKAIQVKLESFEKPTKEYLVPFGRVTEILKENGYELVGSSLFGDHYATQSKFLLNGDLQTFSFLHRSFVFKRVAVMPKPKEPEQEVEVPVVAPPPEPATAAAPEPTAAAPPEKPKKRTIKAKVPVEEGPEPVFFFIGNPALNEYKEFSNMHEAPMQVEGITFPTVEHYYQWAKAKQFGDAGAQAKILKTASPKTAKAIGKKVTPFDAGQWEERKDQVMRTGIKAKLMQHPEILKKLRDTGDRLIGEADPRDKYWSIGTSSDTSFAKNPERWKGQNKLGKILMELRTELKE
jgi:ribA/ribD-fused uncharacterized protein